VKFIFTCAMVFALSGLSAFAADERAPSSAATSAPAANSVPVSPLGPALTASSNLPGTLPAAPAPVDSLMTSPASAAISTSAALAPPTAIVKLKAPSTHRFFDVHNSLGLAFVGASLTADALSTQKGLAYPGFREMNPIARPFVQSRLGAAAYNAGSFGLFTGLMYVAHKTQHHKLEHILPFAFGGWEGLLSARNYHVIANRK
jgi:hypothetical protein